MTNTPGWASPGSSDSPEPDDGDSPAPPTSPAAQGQKDGEKSEAGKDQQVVGPDGPARAQDQGRAEGGKAVEADEEAVPAAVPAAGTVGWSQQQPPPGRWNPAATSDPSAGAPQPPRPTAPASSGPADEDSRPSPSPGAHGSRGSRPRDAAPWAHDSHRSSGSSGDTGSHGATGSGGSAEAPEPGRYQGGNAYGQWAPPPPRQPNDGGPRWGPAAPTGWQHGGSQQGPAGWGGPPAPKPGVIPLRPLSVGEILDAAIATTRRYWRAILGVTLAVALVTKGIEVVVQGLFIDDTRLKNLQNESNPSTSDILHAISGSMAGLALIVLVTLVGVLITTAILTTVMGRAVIGQPITASEAWRKARPQLPRLIGVTFLVPVIITAVMAVCVLPGLLVALAGSTNGGGALATLGVLAGLCVAIRLWVQLSLAAPALMLEQQDIVSAMKRSAKLVSGSWWRVLGMQLLAGIIAYLASTIITVPFALVATGVTNDGFGNLMSASSSVSWTYLIISGIGGVFGAAITLPISSGVLTLLYMDQRIRREALDIDLARAAGV